MSLESPAPSVLQRWRQWWQDRWGLEPPAARRGVRKGLRLYAIGDIHGRADLLDQLMRKIDVDLARKAPQQALAVFLGDYVDRGPETAGVIERLVRGGFALPYVTLRGNHEDAMLRAIESSDAMERWCDLGGLATIASYGVDIAKIKRRKALLKARLDWLGRLPRAHHEFLSGTRLFQSIDDYFFVHAGVRPGIALDQQHEDDLLWIREEFLTSDYDFGKVIVHGHTPRRLPESKPGRINVDTGAFKWGALTTVVLEGTERRFLSTRSERPSRSAQ